jgi:tetratricopeptide (TPR) repeat protein
LFSLEYSKDFVSPFRLLLLLLENHTELVTRERLRQELWSEDTFVEFENSLRVAIGKIREAIPNYKLAIDLDPRFALAYGRIGTIYASAQEFTLARQFLQKAFDIRDRATERERLYLTSKYYTFVLGDYEKAISIYQLWRQVYPNDLVAANNIADCLIAIGQPEAAISPAQDAMRINPRNAFPYIVLGQAYQRSGKFAEAKDIYQQAVSRNLVA